LQDKSKLALKPTMKFFIWYRRINF